uniref:Putative kazal-type inhibitor n=1 Tax=Panstrongylus megistus TaxID=65343 RepID=A0A069DMH4_9HEMI
MKFNNSVLSVALIAVFLTACMAYYPHHCGITCSDKDKPICGARTADIGYQRRTFGNDCKLLQENECGKGPDWKKIARGRCEDLKDQ